MAVARVSPCPSQVCASRQPRAAVRRSLARCHWKNKNKGTPGSRYNTTNKSKAAAEQAAAVHAAAHGPPPDARPPPVMLDGANLAWAYADAIARKTGYRGRIGPLSRGVTLAMEHEAIKDSKSVAFLPRHYVIGTQRELLDGWNVPRECVETHTSIVRVSKLSKKKTVRNEAAWALVESGAAELVTRNTSAPAPRNRDDVELLVEAKRTGALVCTNDMFRDHKRNRALGFRQTSHFKDWLRRSRFEFEFRVTGEVDEAALAAEEAARDPAPLEGDAKWTIIDEDAERPGGNADHLGRPKRGMDPRHPLLWQDKLTVEFVPKVSARTRARASLGCPGITDCSMCRGAARACTRTARSVPLGSLRSKCSAADSLPVPCCAVSPSPSSPPHPRVCIHCSRAHTQFNTPVAKRLGLVNDQAGEAEPAEGAQAA